MSSLDASTKIKLNIWKWVIIVIVGGFVFYIVYPKYTFKFGPNTFRANSITGKVDTIEKDKSGKYAWVDQIEFENRQ